MVLNNYNETLTNTTDNTNHSSKRGKISKLLLLAGIFALLATGIVLGIGVAPAHASPLDDCPSSLSGVTTASDYIVSSPALSTSMTWSLTTPSKPASSLGVPGVLEFCVYPNNMPDVTGQSTTAIGADGSSWSASINCSTSCVHSDRFSGNPTNIPDDGTTTSNILTITFSLAPSSFTVVMHIIDSDHCGGSTDNPNTCFVYPSTIQTLKKTDICGTATAGKPFTCTATVTGGVPPYTITWTIPPGCSGPTTGPSIIVTCGVKGTYPISDTVTDSQMPPKTASASTTVVVTQQPFSASITCTGSIPTPTGPAFTVGKPFPCTVSATGGTAPYVGTGDFQVIEPTKGNFHVCFAVTDANGKSTQVCAYVHVLQQPYVPTVVCNGPFTAGKPFTCTVSATGGTQPYSGTGDVQVTEPVKGTFTETFTVTDSNGKSAVASTSVTVVQQPFVPSVVCNGPFTAGKPFTCVVSATGGTAPYGGTGDVQLTEPVKGTFVESFTVTDANGKSAVASAQVDVVQQPFSASVDCGSGQTAGKPFTCTVSATGGTQPYGGTGDFSVTEPVKGTFTESFVVTEANGKSATASISVTVVQQPFTVGVVCGSAGTPITAGKPFNCIVSATGGTAPYKGDGMISVTEPVKGTFTESFLVKDANGKSAIASTMVTVVQQPFVPSVVCNGPFTAGKPFTCVVSATGGTAPYGGTGDVQLTEPVKGTFVESFTVTDANGKSAATSASVTVLQQPFTVSVDCGSGQTAGKPFSCTVSATGGTAPYSGTGSIMVTQPVKGSFTESFTVTDANGKSKVASTMVTVVQQPFVPSVVCNGPFTAGKPFTCTVSATGGTSPYGGTGDIMVTEPVKGTFVETFTVTDANGKSAATSASVTVLQQPFVPSVVCNGPFTAGKPFTCIVSATGGTAPYQGTGTFSITEPVKGTPTESFTVTDANGKSATTSAMVTILQQPFVVGVVCGASTPTGQITAGKPFSCTVSATGGTQPYQGTGTFTVVQPVKGSFHQSFNVKDANGKMAVATTIVTVIQQPFVAAVTCGSASAAITSGKPFNCTVSASGGTAPYQGTGSFTIIQPVKGSFTESFTVTDANGKSTIASTQVTVVQQPFVPSVVCNGPFTAGKPFSCTVSATGGTTPYQGTGTFTRTEPVKGTRTESFTVTDANGKSVVASTTVNVLPQPLMADFTAVCLPASGSESFTAAASGGTSPYTFSWNFGDTQTGTGNPATHTYSSGGVFTVTLTVTDANGKSTTVTHTITACGGAVTNTVFCSFGNTFPLILITDPQNTNAFTLVSTNPGQFYDNVFLTGSGSFTMTVSIPYPFVTNGARPIQVSSSVGLTSSGCFVPSFDNPSGITITTAGGVLSSSGYPIITLADYGTSANLGSTTTITVSGTIPGSGLVYVTVHLEYGLLKQDFNKVTTGTASGTPTGISCVTNPCAQWTANTAVIIGSPEPYTFGVSGALTTSSTVTSTNNFKKDPGFAGVVINSATMTGMAGVTVKVYDNNGMLVGMTTTDTNGVYLYVYKYTGTSSSAVKYTVKAMLPSGTFQIATVSMQSNKMVLQNFTF